MADFDREERRLLENVLPRVAMSLRSPLNNLHMAAARLAARQEGDSDEAAVLRQSCYRMLRLVNNLSMGPELLSDKRYDTRNEELAVLLDELCRQADSIAREGGVRVIFDCKERYVVAAVERISFERMVWNLLSNALKSTPKGGTVTVALAVRGGQVLLEVRDTGCGIPAEQMATLFDRWAGELENGLPRQGLGLGLPICRRIAQAHGGRLLLRSREGEGTVVTVALPHVRREGGLLEQSRPDYAGGFSHVMMELSDALPYQAFYERHLD